MLYHFAFSSGSVRRPKASKSQSFVGFLHYYQNTDATTKNTISLPVASNALPATKSRKWRLDHKTLYTVAVDNINWQESAP